MLELKSGNRLENLWDPAKAAGMSEPELLLYRSNLLGADKRITNYGGGNTSAKVTETRPADRRAGRGALGQGLGRRRRHDQARRLRHALHGQARGAEGPLPRRRARGRDGGLPAPLHLRPQPARRLDRHAAARLRAARACRPHARRRDHRHRRLEGLEGADRARSSATRSAGCRGSARATSSASGSSSSAARTRTRRAWCSRATASSPGATTRRSCYETTIDVINRAIDWLESATAGKPAFGGAAARAPSPPPSGARIAAALMPAIRGMVSKDVRMVGHFDDQDAVLEFVNAADMPPLAALGTSCPDHFLRTKIRPLVVDFDPAAPDLDATLAGLPAAVEAYRAGLRRLLRALPAARTARRCATRTRSSTSCPASA